MLWEGVLISLAFLRDISVLSSYSQRWSQGTLKVSESLLEGEQSQNYFPNNTDSAGICTELQKQ